MNSAKKMWKEMNEGSNLLASFLTVAIAFIGLIFVVLIGIVALSIFQKLGMSFEIMKTVAAFVVIAPILIILLHNKINKLAKSIVNFNFVKIVAFNLPPVTIQTFQIRFKTRFLAVPTSPPRPILA